jgi:hypothetical protein
MSAQWLSRADRLVGCFRQYQSLTGRWILRNHEVSTCSSRGSNPCCCSTNRPHIEWSSRLSTPILSVKCRVMLTFQLDIVVVEFLEITCWMPSMTIRVMHRTKVSFYPSFWYTDSSIWQPMAGCVWLWFLFLSRVSWIKGAVEHHSWWQIRSI